MKKMVKRLVYTSGDGRTVIGGYEYDAHLSDANILGSLYEPGRTTWIGNSLWTIYRGRPVCKITVELFSKVGITRPRKTFFERVRWG
jgi:hypothetical protein